MKIYTRGGDKGQTSLYGGARVSKASARVAAYGTLDELNSYLGICAAHLRGLNFANELEWVLQVQRDLFALGSWLASPEACERVTRGEEAFPGAKQARTHLDLARVTQLEHDIDGWEKTLTPMKSFILPGGAKSGAHAHMARALCRRAERETVLLREQGEVVPDLAIQFLNRLADALFVFGRHLNAKLNIPEDPWN